MEDTKICNGIFCKGAQRSLNEFAVVKGKIRYQCRKCFRERAKIRQRKYRVNHKNKLRIRQELYRKNNYEKLALQRKNNRENLRKKNRIYEKNNRQKIHDKKQSKLKNQDGYIKYLIHQLRSVDKKNDRDFDIDYEYITELIKKQNNKCIYSNAELVWQNKSGIYQGSIDRIESNKGHIKGNCQLVTTALNRFKNDLSHDKFMELINLIKNSKNNNEDNVDEFITYTDSSVKIRAKIRTMFKHMKEHELNIKRRIKINELTAKGFNKKEARAQAIKEITKDNINFEIDINFFDELRRKCNNRCALTNIKLTLQPNCINTASVDRKDSSKGYEKDNIQITSWYVNCMKRDLSDDVAKQILDQIIIHNSNENH